MQNSIDDYPDFKVFFAYDHLPAHLQGLSKPFGDLATELASKLPRCAETTSMLRKLLEAKDCAVRAQVLWIKENKG